MPKPNIMCDLEFALRLARRSLASEDMPEERERQLSLFKRLEEFVYRAVLADVKPARRRRRPCPPGAAGDLLAGLQITKNRNEIEQTLQEFHFETLSTGDIEVLAEVMQCLLED